MIPLEVAKILIFSQNHYDFWISAQNLSENALKNFVWGKYSTLLPVHYLALNRAIVTSCPLEAAKILFSAKTVMIFEITVQKMS